MDNFIYQYPIKQYFGKGCAEEAIKTELKKVGENVLLAYGGGSLKRTGLYDKLRTWLEASDKNVTDFGGIMPNPTYAKVQEGAQLVRENNIDFILAVGGGSVIDCCKIVSAQALTDEDARPALATHIKNLNEYDVVFVGFPNWWYDMPQPLYTFFDEYDFSGKTVVPFCTHGGSRFSDAIKTIREMEKGATVLDGYAIARDRVSSSKDGIQNWLKKIGMTE